MSYIIKITGETVEYVKAIRGRQDDASIGFAVRLKDMDFSRDGNSILDFLKSCIRARVSIRGIVLAPPVRLWLRQPAERRADVHRRGRVQHSNWILVTN